MQANLTHLPQPKEIRAYIDQREQRLKPFYRRIEEAAPQLGKNKKTLLGPNWRRELSSKRGLLLSAQILELTAVVAAITESATSLQIKTIGDLASQAEQVKANAEARTGLSLKRVFEENLQLLDRQEHSLASINEPLQIPIDSWVRRIAALLAEIPVDRLEEIARIADEPELGHRCRRAYECLREFVKRHDPRLNQKLKTLGGAYAEGRLSLQEVCSVLGLSEWDIIPELERLGFSRRISKLSLQEEERRAILEKIRADRLARNGEPSFNPNQVAREVIATQRIEDVDARSWLTPKP
jgi:hypothetical protein